MTFYFLKFISDLFSPAALCLELLAIGLVLGFAAKRKKASAVFLLLGFMLFVVFGYGLAGRPLVSSLERRYPPLLQAGGHAGVKWVVVLGGGLASDLRLPLTGQLSDGAQLRLIEGIRICRQLPGAKLLVSGGAVFNSLPEADAMAGLAVQLGVPAANIVAEPRSLNTEQQAAIIRGIVGGDSLALVTSAAHMPRSMALFLKAGMQPLPAPANYLLKNAGAFNPAWLFPGSGGFGLTETAFHEYLGLAWAKIRGKI